MNEAMSRHEIEDVLSSIRRLVSHEDRAAQAQPAASGKLVLTSEQRVDDATAPVPEDRPSDSLPTPDPGSDLARPSRSDDPGAQAGRGYPGFVDAPLQTAPSMSHAPTADAAQPTAPDVPVAARGPAAENMAPPASSDTPLEATLARLEEALSIAPTDPAGQAETVIDEDALSEMVARMVREELQGELGERITRNIRKLVRAEVARELQMRNL